MPEREKVIRALEMCGYKEGMIQCDECPYDGKQCWSRLKQAAIALLKEQEPRVMTLEEVAAWHSIPESKRDPIYVEYQPNSGLGVSHWRIEYFGFNPNSYTNKNSGYYGKWLRCWTSRPTEEQREAMKWGA